MEEWSRRPIHKMYVYTGIPKFPNGDSDEYLYQYINWLHENSLLKFVIKETCFVIETTKYHKLFFDFGDNIIYSNSFPDTIP